MGKGVATLGSMAETCNDPANLPMGQVIAVGTVLVNKKPAAKKNDQVVGVDIHIVLVPAPPAPPIPTPLPHPYTGIIDGALSTTVNIMSQPAAMVDSTATNTPSHIATPPGVSFQKPPDNKAKIILGSFDVMIGDSGASGSGSGSGDSGGDSVQAKAAAVEVDKGHFLYLRFVDKGGKTITGVNYEIKTPDNKKMSGVITGPLKKAGLEEGDYEIALKAITKAEWSDKSANVGDKVKLLVDTVGVKDDEKAILSIFIKSANCPDKQFKTIESRVSGGKVEEEWELKIDDEFIESYETGEKSERYRSPSFYFTVNIARFKAKSGMLAYKDWVEMKINDPDGKALANREYKVYCSDGQVKEGKLDGDGYAKIEGVSPGKVKVKIDPRKK